MTSPLLLREGAFDVVVVAGPRVPHWPTAGARAISALCAEAGLSVGMFGGPDLRVRGVIPLPGTGGIALIEDAQGRIHRLQARAIVKLSGDPRLPDPFPGWFSEGLIPLSTAKKLRRESELVWDPATVILGTGNKALRFGCELLESGFPRPEVICLESFSQWGAKRFAGWEVEKRRFEMLGGEILEAKPVKLTPKAALLWEFRVQDAQGVRIIEVSRVIAAGPFRDSPGVREYPSGSFLFELDQTAEQYKDEDVEGWVIEEERGRFLAGRIIRSLVADHGARREREEIDRTYNRARSRLKRYFAHREAPFTPSYQGKWIASADSRRMKSFSGVPQEAQKKKLVASVECFEEIPCNICQTVCPVDAITIGKVPRGKEKILEEDKCIGCGLCVSACPSAAIPMIQETEERPLATLVLPWRGERLWAPGEFAILYNRRGDNLGNAKVLDVEAAIPDVSAAPSVLPMQRVKVEVPAHLIWEARSLGLNKKTTASAEDEAYLTAVERSASAEHKVEIMLDGEKRLVRDKISLSMALFEAGRNRPGEGLFCGDGSCGLCQVVVDGVKRLACVSKTHRGMATELENMSASPDVLCPCLGIAREEVVSRIRQGNLQSPEALLSVLHVGEGKCHGQLCMSAFRRILAEEGIDVSSWVDWRFPWTEWVLGGS